MKEGIHPKYEKVVVHCGCGNTFETRSTAKAIHAEICSNCHPFFSGESARMIDIEGQVDRFYKKLQVRQTYVEEKKSREEAKVSPKRSIVELELGARPTAALDKAGIKDVGQFLAKLSEGEAAVLSIEGFGRKSLIDMKKKLRLLGYELPEVVEIPAA